MNAPEAHTPGNPGPSDQPLDDDHPVMPIEEFTALASKLVSLSMYREAIGIYNTAIRLYPENLALKINIARVRDIQQRADEKLLLEHKGTIQEKRGRDDMLAQHALGVAVSAYRKNELDKAREYLEYCLELNPHLHATNLLLGRIYLGNGQAERALEYLEDTRRTNPFDEQAHSLLGTAYMETGENLRALQEFMDARILAAGPGAPAIPYYDRSIRQLIDRLGIAPSETSTMLDERETKQIQLLDRLERRRRERMANEASSLGAILAARTRTKVSPPKEVFDLRRYPLLERVSDDDLVHLHATLKREEYPAGSLIFGEHDSTRKLYLVDQGELTIRRTTPFGDVTFATFLAGQVLGEMDFLDGLGHSADAVVIRDVSALVLSRPDAEILFAERPAFAVQCLSYFWRSLAEHIRTTNEQMKTFFVSESLGADRKMDEKQIATAEKVIIDIQRKIALFKENGLSEGELGVLATLSKEERYAGGDLIFSEGEPGSKLYVVLEGKVRIEKSIPGVGDEALAVLSAGEFFGEMALVDDKTRSADARAHGGRTTILAIDKRVLDDILAQDLKGAVQFLTIICRILCQRLREINETIVKWKIMSGGF